MSETLRSIEKAAEEIAKAREAYKAKLVDAMSGIFVGAPEEVVGVAWVQYTPNFCDGDPCVFGMHDWCVAVREPGADPARAIEALESEARRGAYPYPEDGDGDEHPSFRYEYVVPFSKSKGQWGENLVALYKLMMNDDSVPLTVFGDGVRVTAVRRPGDASEFITVEHEHD